MRSGGATSAANSDINDRVWKSMIAGRATVVKMDMLSIQLTKGCKCLKTLVCSFLLHQSPLYLKVFYRTRQASRQNIILMLI